jgi:hypothetical protein
VEGNTDVFNLEGFMVGNGATNWDFDVSPSFPETVYNFNLIPEPMFNDYNNNGCVEYFNGFRPTNGTSAVTCDALFGKMSVLTEDLNWYDLYRIPNPLSATKKALKATDKERIGSVNIGGVEKTYKKGYTFAEYTPWIKNHPGLKSQTVYGNWVSDYINNADTRTALHIPEENPAYEDCNAVVGDNWHYQEEASEWIYKVLKTNGVKMLHYSGDTDAAVPTYGTRRWIANLNWSVLTPWKPWFTAGVNGKQVSGYVEEYDGLSFVTVKGVGHMAPQWARQAVQTMITAFMHGESF